MKPTPKTPEQIREKLEEWRSADNALCEIGPTVEPFHSFQRLYKQLLEACDLIEQMLPEYTRATELRAALERADFRTKNIKAGGILDTPCPKCNPKIGNDE